MVVWAAWLVLGLAGCRRERSRPYLVTGQSGREDPAAGESLPSARALLGLATLPLAEVHKRLGTAFRVQEVSALRAAIRGKELDTLGEELLLEVDPRGNLHGVRENSHDQGIEAWRIGEGLVVRFRYGKPVYRKARGNEAQTLFEKLYGSFGASFELAHRFISAKATGNQQFEGRAVRVYSFALAGDPLPMEGPLAPEQRWRADVRMKSLSGRVFIDEKSGMPIFWELRCQYRQQQKGGDDTLDVDLQVRRTLDRFGEVESVAAPADTIASPTRTRYELDARELLEGLVEKRAR